MQYRVQPYWARLPPFICECPPQAAHPFPTLCLLFLGSFLSLFPSFFPHDVVLLTSVTTVPSIFSSRHSPASILLFPFYSSFCFCESIFCIHRRTRRAHFTPLSQARPFTPAGLHFSTRLKKKKSYTHPTSRNPNEPKHHAFSTHCHLSRKPHSSRLDPIAHSLDWTTIARIPGIAGAVLTAINITTKYLYSFSGLFFWTGSGPNTLHCLFF